MFSRNINIEGIGSEDWVGNMPFCLALAAVWRCRVSEVELRPLFCVYISKNSELDIVRSGYLLLRVIDAYLYGHRVVCPERQVNVRNRKCMV